jgi:hypothetical protein
MLCSTHILHLKIFYQSNLEGSKTGWGIDLRIEDGWGFFGLQLVAQKAHFKQAPDDYWCLFRHKGIPEGHLDPFSDEWCGLIEDMGHGQISIDLDWKRLLSSVERASQH